MDDGERIARALERIADELVEIRAQLAELTECVEIDKNGRAVANVRAMAMNDEGEFFERG